MSLFHNDGEGRFTDVSAESGIAADKSYYGFTALTGDFDNDGWGGRLRGVRFHCKSLLSEQP